MKLVFVCSTSGSVIKKAYECYPSLFKDVLIISDRICGSIEFAKVEGLDYRVYETDSGLDFSNYISDLFLNKKDVVFFFVLYTPF